MTIKSRFDASSRVALAAIFAGAALVGCSRGGQSPPGAGNTVADAAPPLDALPLTTAASDSGALAPAGVALPVAPRARIGRLASPGQEYAYLDRAYAMSRAFADAPPDYSYDYGGVRPWVWRSNDGAARVAERLPRGMRYYFYEPGASYPYLVQDPNESYAYSGGQLVAVYDRSGALLPYDDYDGRADVAGRYLARAQALYAASIHQDRLAVQQARWEEQRAGIAAERAQWAQQQSQDAAWQAYHDAHGQDEETHWAAERYRREAEAARFAQATGDQSAAIQAVQAAQQARSLARQYGQNGGGARDGRGPRDPGLPNPGPPARGFSAQASGPSPGFVQPAPPSGGGAGAASPQGASRPSVFGQSGFGQAHPGPMPSSPTQPAPGSHFPLSTQHATGGALAPVAGPLVAADARLAAAHAEQQQLIQQQAARETQAQARAQQGMQQQAARQAEAQAHAQQAAQQQAARQAEVQAHAQAAAQQQAARQAEMQAHAQQLAQQQAARQAEVQVHAQAAAQQQAARQAEAEAQARGQQAAQRQAARQAEAQSRLQQGMQQQAARQAAALARVQAMQQQAARQATDAQAHAQAARNVAAQHVAAQAQSRAKPDAAPKPHDPADRRHDHDEPAGRQ